MSMVKIHTGNTHTNTLAHNHLTVISITSRHGSATGQQHSTRVRQCVLGDVMIFFHIKFITVATGALVAVVPFFLLLPDPNAMVTPKQIVNLTEQTLNDDVTTGTHVFLAIYDHRITHHVFVHLCQIFCLMSIIHHKAFDCQKNTHKEEQRRTIKSTTKQSQSQHQPNAKPPQIKTHPHQTRTPTNTTHVPVCPFDFAVFINTC
jgi:hypothetical protein